MRERRNSIRHGLRWETLVIGNDVTGANFDESGVIENLSSSGAFFYLNKRVPVGCQLDLAIKLPFKKENWMKYSARVVRIEEKSGNGNVGGKLEKDIHDKIGIGIKFDNIKPIFTDK